MPNPWHLNGNPTGRSTREIAILGAGIAGCTAAAALAKRGFKVSIVDRHQSAGCEASGNSQGIVYPKLSPRDDFCRALIWPQSSGQLITTALSGSRVLAANAVLLCCQKMTGSG